MDRNVNILALLLHFSKIIPVIMLIANVVLVTFSMVINVFFILFHALMGRNGIILVVNQ